VLLRPSPSAKKSRVIHKLKTRIPIVGDLFEILKNAHVRHGWLATQCEQLGYEPYLLTLPFTPSMVVLSNPADVQAILTTQFDQFVKGPFINDVLRDFVGEGLLSSDGDQWYHQRKTAAKFFSAKTLRNMMMHAMHKSMDKVYDALDAKYATKELADLTLLFHQLTLQTFTEVGVGVEFPVIGNAKPLPFEAAMDATAPLIALRAVVPTFVWKLQRWLNIGKEAQLAKSSNLMRESARALVEEGLQRLNQKPSSEYDATVRSAIDLFVEHSDPNKVGLRPQDLVDFMLTFVVAARDTTALTLAWFFYSVHKHPEVEAKLRQELGSKLPSLGITDKSDYITTDHVKHLVYLEAAIKETLRLYPAGPFNVRQAVDDTFVNGDLFLKKDQVVAIPIYAMARNGNVWGPDANEFKPERWIDVETGKLLPQPADRFVSFSSGPRMCIGMKLAMTSLRVATANLLYRFKFEIDPSNDGSYVNSAALAMKHNLLAKVERV
jgi:cytochrome P450